MSNRIVIYNMDVYDCLNIQSVVHPITLGMFAALNTVQLQHTLHKVAFTSFTLYEIQFEFES